MNERLLFHCSLAIAVSLAATCGQMLVGKSSFSFRLVLSFLLGACVLLAAFSLWPASAVLPSVVLGLMLSTFLVEVRRSDVRLQTDAQPHPSAGVVVARSTEEQTRQQREHEQFFTLCPVPMASCGFDGKIRDVNPAMADLFGCPIEEVVGQHFSSFVHPQDATAGLNTFTRATESEHAFTKDLRCVRKDGTEIQTIWSVVGNASDHTIYAIGRDVTQQRLNEAATTKAKEEAEAASRAKNEFLSRMSHELRTPLNSILGFAQMLTSTPLTPDQRESVEMLLSGGRHLLRLIIDVLEISRIEAGRVSLNSRPLDANTVMRQAVDLVSTHATERDVTIHLIAPEQPAYVIADPQRLVQAFLNLLSNAVKYNRPKGEVFFRCRQIKKGWRFEVEDTGPGINPRMANRLFMPFERLGAESTSVEGTGLGLAVARSVVEAMDGRIGFESEPGKGSTFWIDMPTSKGVIPEPSEKAPQSNVALQKGGQTRLVLHIEDNAVNRRLIEQALRLRPNLTLSSAASGTRGLDLLGKMLFDVVLLDVHLPDMDGEVIVRHLRDRGDTARIIVLSADATEPTVARLKAAGADEYLTKPIDIARLFEVIDRHLS